MPCILGSLCARFFSLKFYPKVWVSSMPVLWSAEPNSPLFLIPFQRDVCVYVFHFFARSRALRCTQPFAKWHQAKSILSHAMKILHLMTLFLRITLVRLFRSFVPFHSPVPFHVSSCSPPFFMGYADLFLFLLHSFRVAVAILDIVSHIVVVGTWNDSMVHW